MDTCQNLFDLLSTNQKKKEKTPSIFVMSRLQFFTSQLPVKSPDNIAIYNWMIGRRVFSSFIGPSYLVSLWL